MVSTLTNRGSVFISPVAFGSRLQPLQLHTVTQPLQLHTATNGKLKNPSEPSEYVKQMRELWLPSEVNTVRFSGARQTMGYVSKGAFSFSEAKGCGVGYIAYNALFQLLDNGRDKVLIRNTTSLKYRLAKIQIIKDL